MKKEKYWADELNFPERLKEEVFIKHIKGPLFFGSTSDFQNLMRQIPESASSVIIRMDRMQYIDQSGLYVLEDAFIELSSQGKIVLLVDLPKQPRYLLERIDIIPNLIGKDRVFDNFNDCTAWLKDNV